MTVTLVPRDKCDCHFCTLVWLNQFIFFEKFLHGLVPHLSDLVLGGKEADGAAGCEGKGAVTELDIEEESVEVFRRTGDT